MAYNTGDAEWDHAIKAIDWIQLAKNAGVENRAGDILRGTHELRRTVPRPWDAARRAAQLVGMSPRRGFWANLIHRPGPRPDPHIGDLPIKDSPEVAAAYARTKYSAAYEALKRVDSESGLIDPNDRESLEDFVEKYSIRYPELAGRVKGAIKRYDEELEYRDLIRRHRTEQIRDEMELRAENRKRRAEVKRSREAAKEKAAKDQGRAEHPKARNERYKWEHAGSGGKTNEHGILPSSKTGRGSTMTNLELLTQTIAGTARVSFRYLRPGKAIGRRVGDPHAVFYHPGTGNILTHIYQQSGDSESGEPLPGWRTFHVDDIQDIEFLDVSFRPAPRYKPNSPLYAQVISKV